MTPTKSAMSAYLLRLAVCMRAAIVIEERKPQPENTRPVGLIGVGDGDVEMLRQIAAALGEEGT